VARLVSRDRSALVRTPRVARGVSVGFSVTTVVGTAVVVPGAGASLTAPGPRAATATVSAAPANAMAQSLPVPLRVACRMTPDRASTWRTWRGPSSYLTRSTVWSLILSGAVSFCPCQVSVITGIGIVSAISLRSPTGRVLRMVTVYSLAHVLGTSIKTHHRGPPQGGRSPVGWVGQLAVKVAATLASASVISMELRRR
jgi:hypothetical protein